MIVHSGGIHSGHYITYRKGPFGSKSANKWFYTSDSSVRQVHYEEVSKTPAYMLFYEKLSDTDYIWLLLFIYPSGCADAYINNEDS